ncbi:MAG: hypothetical protein ABII23_07635 [bacterium]
MKKFSMVLIIICFGAYVHAVISIDPLRREISAKPGEKIKGAYTITNTEDQPIVVTVTPKKHFVLEENKKFKLNDWFKLSDKEFTLQGKGSKEIQYTIKIPRKAQGFLMLNNSFLTRKLDTSGAVVAEMLNTAISVPIYIQIDGTAQISAEIKDLAVTGDVNNLIVYVTVSNSGNVYLRPSGTISIDQNGKNLGTAYIKKGWPVFPEKTESYRTNKASFSLEPGIYDITAHLTNTDPVIELTRQMQISVDDKGMVKTK